MSYPRILFILLIPILLYIIGFTNTEAETKTDTNTQKFVIEAKPLQKNILRIGLNLGYQTNWGSEQFAKNIVFNPGFEPPFGRFVVLISRADEKSFSNEGWEHPDHAWKGATYDIRTGPAAGTKGKIKDSLEKGVDGQPQYFTEEALPPLKHHDVVILTKQLEPEVLPFANWWFLYNKRDGVGVSKDVRPGSPGVQSLTMTAKTSDPIGVVSYIDHAGKFLIMKGKWKISFWSKAEGQNSALMVNLKRFKPNGELFSKVISIGPTWKEYSYEFTANESGPQDKLALELLAQPSAKSKIFLDDVSVVSLEDPSVLAFRKEVVNLLKELKPSYLRDWQNQNSDKGSNRLAAPFARQSNGVWPDSHSGDLYWNYSLPEFLDLCQEVKANPWIIIPVVGSDEEYAELGQFLAKNAGKSRFSDVIVEFGNENWNWMFRPAGFPYAEPHGKVAERAFNLLTTHGAIIRKLIGGQHVNPWLTMQYATYAPSADIVSVAAYFFGSLEAGTPQKDAIAALFAPDQGYLKQTVKDISSINKKVATYEINMHTTHGSASAEERNLYVTGALSGTALAKHLLENISLGMQPNMVFTFAQYDVGTDNGKTVNLWGITRDVGPTLRLRPTGLAVKMLNNVLGGDLYTGKRQASVSKETLQIYALKQTNAWKGIVISENALPQTIEIDFPSDNLTLPSVMNVLDAKTPFDNNEDSEKVKIVQKPLEIKERTLKLTVPPYGLVTF